MAQIIQRSFTSGEIAPALRSRADVVKYATGLALCENMFVKPQGGCYSRQGTRFIGEVADSTVRGRLIPFSFNTTQNYILEFGHLVMRVIKDGGYVLDGAGPAIYELATPFREEYLPGLRFTQSADVMTITHPDLTAVRELSRADHDDWSIASVDFTPSIDPPEWASTTVANISNISQSTTVVVTANAHGLSTGVSVLIEDVVGMTEVNDRYFEILVTDVNNFILIDEDSSSYTAYSSGGTATSSGLSLVGTGAGDYDKTYTYVVTAVKDDGEESLASESRSIETKSLSTTAGVKLTWSTVADADYYRVYKDPSDGTGVYGWIGDSNTTEFTDFNIAPLTSDAPPIANTPFTGTDNRPAVAEYYQQRLLFAATNNQPQTFFATQVGNYNSLRSSVPSRADDAFEFTINSKQVNRIRHIIAMDALILMTSGGVWRVTEGQDQVLTPSTVGVKIQSTKGVSDVIPVIVDDDIIYIQEKGKRVRSVGYNFVDDKYAGVDLSITAQHMFEDYEIEEMTYADEPFGIVWMVRSDGQLVGLTYQKEHQVVGFHRHITDGEFESVATISEDGRDAVYAIVKRTINSATVRYVERFEPRYVTAPEDVFCVDSGLTYEGAAATIITGLDHLDGKDVAVVADGNVVTGLTVGAVTGGIGVVLPRAATKVVVGLPFTPVIETLDIDTASPVETMKGKEVSVSKVILEVEKSRGGWVGPKLDDGSTGTITEIKPRFDSDGYGAIQLKTFKQEVTIEPTWSKGGGIRIEQRDPMPLAILSVIPEVDVS